ncbi:MAG: DUF1109 domain-containing protein [Micavibrio sp.]|nr:DUF1109 domain-containing protein [Micavibrio sp.]
MATDDLINQLASNLKPVRRLPAPLVRVLYVLGLTALVLAAAISLLTHGLRPDIATMLGRTGYLSQNLSFLAAGICAALAAFRLSVPDVKIRPATYAFIFAATAIWLVHIIALSFEGGLDGVDVGQRNCLTDLSLFMVVPLAATTFMLTRGAPVWRGWAGYSMVLAIGSFCAIGMRFLCPNDQPAHLLVWHFMPVMVFALAGIALGKILLKPRTPKLP